MGICHLWTAQINIINPEDNKCMDIRTRKKKKEIIRNKNQGNMNTRNVTHLKLFEFLFAELLCSIKLLSLSLFFVFSFVN